MINSKEFAYLFDKYVFSDDKNVYIYVLLFCVLSFLISLFVSLFEFNFRNFLILFSKLLIGLLIIFNIIIYYVNIFLYHDMLGILADNDDFLYKLIIIDTMFFCLFLLIKKYNLW